MLGWCFSAREIDINGVGNELHASYPLGRSQRQLPQIERRDAPCEPHGAAVGPHANARQLGSRRCQEKLDALLKFFLADQWIHYEPPLNEHLAANVLAA
jgi:hypothetical protein